MPAQVTFGRPQQSYEYTVSNARPARGCESSNLQTSADCAYQHSLELASSGDARGFRIYARRCSTFVPYTSLEYGRVAVLDFESRFTIRQPLAARRAASRGYRVLTTLSVASHS